MPGAVTIIIAVVITLIVAVPVSALVAINYRKNVVEAKLGSAEEKARQIIDDGQSRRRFCCPGHFRRFL